MTVNKQFSDSFSELVLKDIYQSHVIFSGALGIDNLNQKAFWPIQDKQISIISKKVLSGNYKFTKYRLKLISKGRAKPPREISIPTVRDRIAFRALCDFLSKRFKKSIKFELPQNVVKSLNNHVELGAYDGFIKLDVTNFYPSIKHDELQSRLRKRIKSTVILNLIENAICTPTVFRSCSTDKPEKVGVPQGLAISNILSAIYLLNIDRHMRQLTNIIYYRYVDDILILCKYVEADEIARDLIKRFKKIGLEVHDPIKAPEKSKIGHLDEQFEYLGYQFDNGVVSCRLGSLDKLRDSIVSIFTGYKYSLHKNQEFLLWRLNLRITGCIFENKRKGWLFYFSEMNDEEMLHILDVFVQKLINRFSVKIQPKKFVRTFYQIKHQKYESKYIPNFDEYTLEQMKDVLTIYFKKNISKLDDIEIEYEFKKRISRQVKDLLEDVQDFS